MSGLVTKLTEIFWTVPLYDAQSLKNVALQCLQAYIFFVNTVQTGAKDPLLRSFYAFAAKPCPPHSAAQSFQQNSCCFAVCTKRMASALENLPKYSHSSEFYNLALLYFAVV